jgi:hypothetical protein
MWSYEIAVRLWNIKETQHSSIMGLIKELQDISQSCIGFKLLFASRVCNRVARELAKQALTSAQVGEWRIAPTCVCDLLVADCNPGA